MRRITNKNEDLRTVDPKGRLDVVAYKGLKLLSDHVETKHGIRGIWDNVEPHAQTLVKSLLSGIEVPAEVKGLMGILQANLPTNEGR